MKRANQVGGIDYSGTVVAIERVIYICPTLDVSLSFFFLKYINSVGFSQCHKLYLLFFGGQLCYYFRCEGIRNPLDPAFVLGGDYLQSSGVKLLTIRLNRQEKKKNHPGPSSIFPPALPFPSSVSFRNLHRRDLVLLKLPIMSNAISQVGAFVNRKFSINRNTGQPRIRRFSVAEPSGANTGKFVQL